jgi:hypothetical protein
MRTEPFSLPVTGMQLEGFVHHAFTAEIRSVLIIGKQGRLATTPVNSKQTEFPWNIIYRPLIPSGFFCGFCREEKENAGGIR